MLAFHTAHAINNKLATLVYIVATSYENYVGHVFVRESPMKMLDAGNRIGTYREADLDGRQLRAYIPVELPFDPPLTIDPESQQLLQEAYLSIGRLDGSVSALPDRYLLIYMYLRKEAVLSSQIEGTQESLETFLRQEGDDRPGLPASDIREISNHVIAAEYGLKQLQQSGFSIELIEGMHGVLLKSGRGSGSQPGRIRDRQNIVGSSHHVVYVPPPADAVAALLQNLIGFIRQGNPPGGALVCCALAHVQFESIHPFMDGNGRLGRLLVNLLLCDLGILHWPILFLSMYFKRHRKDYYALLNDVREHGDWESWLKFFLRAVCDTADSASASSFTVARLLAEDRESLSLLDKQEGSARQVYEYLLRHPLTTAPEVARNSGLSQPTARSVLEQFCKLGICSEITSGSRNRTYRYDRYLDQLNAGTELLNKQD